MHFASDFLGVFRKKPNSTNLYAGTQINIPADLTRWFRLGAWLAFSPSDEACHRFSDVESKWLPWNLREEKQKEGRWKESERLVCLLCFFLQGKLGQWDAISLGESGNHWSHLSREVKRFNSVCVWAEWKATWKMLLTYPEDPCMIYLPTFGWF